MVNICHVIIVKATKPVIEAGVSTLDTPVSSLWGRRRKLFLSLEKGNQKCVIICHLILLTLGSAPLEG